MTEFPKIQPPVIAHRGASAYAPENTIAAFTIAAQLGIKWVEFDTMLAACGIPIVFHDEEVNRTTNSKGLVGDYSYTYLRTLDAGGWFNSRFSGERIPPLDQVLNFLRDTNMSANIEIKPLPGQDKKTALRVFEMVNTHFPQPSPAILFSSFSTIALETLRQESKDCFLGLLMDDWRPDWQMLCDDLKCISVHVSNNVISPEKAKKIKDTGRLLLCYTVNDPLRANELYSWGVDAVFSDAPDKILGTA